MGSGRLTGHSGNSLVLNRKPVPAARRDGLNFIVDQTLPGKAFRSASECWNQRGRIKTQFFVTSRADGIGGKNSASNSHIRVVARANIDFHEGKSRCFTGRISNLCKNDCPDLTPAGQKHVNFVGPVVE